MKIICPLPLSNKKKKKKVKRRDGKERVRDSFDAIEERSSILEATILQ